MKNDKKASSYKAFGLWSAVFLGIGSMVGAGIFIVIGQAGALVGNAVWFSFVIGGIAALLSGYSLAKLAVAYPSRGGIVEYAVQCYGEGFFSGSIGVLFYMSQLIAIAAVAKSFGTYAATFMHGGTMSVNLFALGIVALFTAINLIGAGGVAKSETIIVVIKVGILLLFTAAALRYVDPSLLSQTKTPPLSAMFYAAGLTFFAYQGFSVITNTVEDMDDAPHTVLRAMLYAIFIVALLYVATSVAVLGNLPLEKVIETKDYALAEAAKPIFGEWGFKVMAATALLATASAINATLYATTEIGYTLAKEGNLPKEYAYNVFRSYEGLVISALLIVPMVLFFDLSQVTTVAALIVLSIQGLVHAGHLFRLQTTGAHRFLVFLAVVAMFTIAGLTMYKMSDMIEHLGFYVLGAFATAFLIEAALRLGRNRIVRKQCD